MLKKTMIANAASCLGFGLLFVAASTPVAAFLGTAPAPVVLGLGVGLILNGIWLLLTARKPAPTRVEILQFVAGDAMWVLATLALILMGLWITTTAGIIAALLVAAMVGIFGWLQWRHAPAA